MACRIGQKASAIALLILACAAFLSADALADGNDAIGNVPVLLASSGLRDAAYEECTLGDALADAVARSVDCDVVILNGGDLTGNLQPGSASGAMLEECIAPDRRIATVKISPRRLAALLEAALSHVVLTPERSYAIPDARHAAFPQISGMKLIYDPAAPPGQRLVRVTLESGALDLQDDTASLTLAATCHMLDGGYEMPPVAGYTATDRTLTDAMEAYIRGGLGDYERPGKRIRATGIRTNDLQIGYLALMAGVIVIVFLAGGVSWKKKTAKRDLLSTGSPPTEADDTN